jgi:hypothetical protein
MRYLVDTDIIVDHLRIGEEKATEFLKKLKEVRLKPLKFFRKSCSLLK